MGRIMLTAPASNSGKTLITCAVLSILKKRGLNVKSYKCGPDYIDTMFHREVLGVPSENIDLFIMGDEFSSVIDKKADISVIEGVMGYYDGMGGISTENSSYDIAGKTDTPSVLIVDCKGRSVSIVAEVLGFLKFKPDSHIKGVILNRISPMLYTEIKQQVEESGVKVLGYLPFDKRFSFESRHLGLITPKENADINEKLRILCETAEKTLDIDGLIKLSETAPDIQQKSKKALKKYDLKIAVAKDEAFCFYYEDNLRILKEMGAEIIYFSPMGDEKIPQADGIILWGGYPELYAEKLSRNESMRNSVKSAIKSGIPCIAECGGFLYLHNTLEDTEGKVYKMAEVIDADAIKTDKLNNFGYFKMTAEQDNILCKKGESINIHEFHYWQSDCKDYSFNARKPNRNREHKCVYVNGNLFAGFPHIHFRQNINLADNFLRVCQEHKNDIGKCN